MKDWEETVSTPLKARGAKKPKLVSPSDKHATSGTPAYSSQCRTKEFVDKIVFIRGWGPS